jgi:hypothetical protein
MCGWRRRVVAAVVAVVVLAPLLSETFRGAVAVAQAVGDTVSRNVGQSIPRPVLIAAGLILLLVVSFAVIFGLVRLFTEIGAASGERLATTYDRLTPDSPQTKALAFMVVFVVVFIGGLGVAAPWFANALVEDSGIGDVVSDIEDARYEGQLEELFADDGVESDSPTVSKAPPNTTDSDGDGFPDAWEEVGVTPWGMDLSTASPDRMDLYVQFNYGANVTGMTESERQQLRSVWNTMPIENPDGSSGIDLHIVDAGDTAGRLNRSVEVGSSDRVDRFYTRELLGERYCGYHQVVLGDIGNTNRIGYSETPGYASVLDGGQFDGYDGDVTFRVAMVTHALLHNVVGPVEDGTHTDGGWLDYPDPDNEELTDAVAERIDGEGFVTTQDYREECT